MTCTPVRNSIRHGTHSVLPSSSLQTLPFLRASDCSLIPSPLWLHLLSIPCRIRPFGEDSNLIDIVSHHMLYPLNRHLQFGCGWNNLGSNIEMQRLWFKTWHRLWFSGIWPPPLSNYGSGAPFLLNIWPSRHDDELPPLPSNYGNDTPLLPSIWHDRHNDELQPPPSNFGNVVHFCFIIWMVLPNAAFTDNLYAEELLPMP